MLGSGRHKIESEEHFAQSLEVCDKLLHLDGVVVIGGDDSNTNAALLGEYFKAKGSNTKCVGVPKTIDGVRSSLRFKTGKIALLFSHVF